jgi:CheY-like chemotaxis protein
LAVEVRVMSILAGCTVLVIEDEPLVALDMREAFEQVFARVEIASTRAAALRAMRPDVAAAVLDLSLNDADAGALCDQLRARSIPFVVYSGYPSPTKLDVPFFDKPTCPTVLVEAIQGLLNQKVLATVA